VKDVDSVLNSILDYLEFRGSEIEGTMDSGATKNMALSQAGWLVKNADTRYSIVNERKA